MPRHEKPAAEGNGSKRGERANCQSTGKSGSGTDDFKPRWRLQRPKKFSLRQSLVHFRWKSCRYLATRVHVRLSLGCQQLLAASSHDATPAGLRESASHFSRNIAEERRSLKLHPVFYHRNTASPKYSIFQVTRYFSRLCMTNAVANRLYVLRTPSFEPAFSSSSAFTKPPLSPSR